MAMLEVRDLEVYYGVIQAIKGISFDVNQGEIVALIGANGAGKTTTLHTITGLISAKTGKIVYEGTDITRVPGYKLVGMGIAHVPEGRRVFATLTVLQNLKMGAYTRKDKEEIEATLKMIYQRFPRLEERKNQLAGTLSGGEQQMLAMGRALMSHPRMIVMDEPSMGLSPIYVNEIFDIIQKINGDGTTVLLVEQNAKKALSIAHKAYVLETGNVALSGDAKELMNNYKDLVKIHIPRTANEMYHLRDARPVDRDELQSGDLVFFRTRGRGAADHVGVYVGNGKFIQSPRTGRDIQITSLSEDYWVRHYVGARRVMTPKTIR